MTANTPLPEQTLVVILAAGKGTRMGPSDLGKVCFEIDGTPAVNRIIGCLKRLRFRSFMLVVGSKADNVIEVVHRDHPEALYVYQEPQLGTGHAAKIAAEALEGLGFSGNVLVTMGDKHLEPEAVELLADGFVRQQADLALLTLPVAPATAASAGLVFVDEAGQALDIIESVDRARQRIADELGAALARKAKITGEQVRRLVDRHIPSPGKQQVAVPELLALAKRGGAGISRQLEQVLAGRQYNLQIDGTRYAAADLERLCPRANPSLYLFRAPAFYRGVAMIDNHNAQGEYYLTDVVRVLSAVRDENGQRRYRVRAIEGRSADWVQGFNSPAELLAIQDYVRRRKLTRRDARAVAERPPLKATQYATVHTWLKKIEDRRPALRRWIRQIYGDHPDLHEQKCRDVRKLLECYGKRFGFDEKVCIVRAPGRVNLMGRHVDHRGGWTNFLAIHRETTAVAGLRDDQDVVAVNTRPRAFGPVRFNVSELIGRFAWGDWLNFVNSDYVRSLLYSAPGDWGNYIKAALLRLQHRFQDVKVAGLNLALTGDVPIAAGLSSSSTLVVAALQAAIALNRFELASRQFIDLCGEGEWFVGSRGGAGDHAAIYLGQRGKIAHVGYLPFRVARIIDAPADYQVVIANSHVKASKSSGAKDVFNARVASYNLGFALLKQRCPEAADLLEHVRDLNPEKLGRPTSDVYRFLLRVPERMTRRDFREMLSGEHRELLEANFASHAEPECYHPRGVLLFGAAEIARSAMAVDLLESGRIAEFGNLMRISHDGDRVSEKGTRYVLPEQPGGCFAQNVPGPFFVSDEYLHGLIADLASEDPEKVTRAQLYVQPGAYACSTVEIDRMVDIASAVPGVAGAQIAGAGLGGCVMILARKGAVEPVRKALVEHYYRPAGLKPAVLPCIAVEGAGLAEF